MKILIVNLHSSRNAGDDVLTQVSVQMLHGAFPQAQICLAMNDPQSYLGTEETVGSFMTWLKPAGHFTLRHLLSGLMWLLVSLFVGIGYRFWGQSVLRWLPAAKRTLLRTYFDADMILSSAGNFLYTSGRFGIAFLLAIYTIAFGWVVGKPLYALPQTIGPVQRRWEKWLVCWIVRKMRLVFVRDTISRDFLQSIGAWHSHCLVVPDVAFGFALGHAADGEALLRRYGVSLTQPLLGVTLINWQAQNRAFASQVAYETAVADAIRSFVKTYTGQVVLFAQVCGPTQAEDDRLPAARVQQLLSDLGACVIFINEIVPAATLKAAYWLMTVFIGTRLHSNIFALSEGVPAILVQYQYKTRGISHMLGIADWVVEIEKVQVPILTNMLHNLYANREDVRHQIETAVVRVQSELATVATQLAADYATRL